MKIRKDLICHRCFEQESNNLLYFKKYYRDTGKIGIFHPTLLCDTCADKQSKDSELFENQPVLIKFIKLATIPMGKIMWLCSYKGKENNDMAEPVWRKKILRIKKIAEGRRQSPVYWMPMNI